MEEFFRTYLDAFLSLSCNLSGQPCSHNDLYALHELQDLQSAALFQSSVLIATSASLPPFPTSLSSLNDELQVAAATHPRENRQQVVKLKKEKGESTYRAIVHDQLTFFPPLEEEEEEEEDLHPLPYLASRSNGIGQQAQPGMQTLSNIQKAFSFILPEEATGSGKRAGTGTGTGTAGIAMWTADLWEKKASAAKDLTDGTEIQRRNDLLVSSSAKNDIGIPHVSPSKWFPFF